MEGFDFDLGCPIILKILTIRKRKVKIKPTRTMKKQSKKVNSNISQVIMFGIVLLIAIRTNGQRVPIGIKWDNKVIMENSIVSVGEDLKLDTAFFFNSIRRDSNLYRATLRFCYNGFLVQSEVRFFHFNKGFTLEVGQIHKYNGSYSALGVVDTYTDVRMGVILTVHKCNRNCKKCTYYPKMTKIRMPLLFEPDSKFIQFSPKVRLLFRRDYLP